MFNVFIVDSATKPNSTDFHIENEVLGECAKIRMVGVNHESDFLPYAKDCDAILAWHDLYLGPGIIERLAKTRIIVRFGVGFDNIDIAAAAARGIPVANVPDYGTEEVADHAITLALALVRQLKPLMTDISGGNWDWHSGAACRRLRDLAFGVVGCGRIGTAAALRAKALGFQTKFFDPYLPSGAEKAIGVARAESLNEILATCDVVSLHTPLSQETRRMIDRAQLERMKPTAFLVNTSRGGVVCHDALVEALAAGRIAGAGLDVLESEPAGMDQIARFPNSIVTPHHAFYSQEAMVELRRNGALTVRYALTEGKFRNLVNGPVKRASAT